MYEQAGITAALRRAFEAKLDRLRALLGIPELMVERALPFLTVYSGRPQINILDAAPQVIAALPGMAPAPEDEPPGARARSAGFPGVP